MIAQYYYKEYDSPSGLLIPRKSLVEIIKNDKNAYLVELLSFCRDHKPGERIRVHKKNIRF